MSTENKPRVIVFDLDTRVLQREKSSVKSSTKHEQLYLVAVLGRHPRHTSFQKGVCTITEQLLLLLKGDQVVDARGSKIKYYPEVPEVLKNLYEEGYELGVASRTSEIQGAKQLLQLFGWDKYFKYKEIYPGCKVNHFSHIQKDSGTSLSEMLFFDDEDRNIHDLTKIGVTSILVRNGVNREVIKNGLLQFTRK